MKIEILDVKDDVRQKTTLLRLFLIARLNLFAFIVCVQVSINTVVLHTDFSHFEMQTMVLLDVLKSRKIFISRRVTLTSTKKKKKTIPIDRYARLLNIRQDDTI